MKEKKLDLGTLTSFAASRALAEGTFREGGGFWRDVFRWHDNVAALVLRRVLIVGVYASLVNWLHLEVGWEPAEMSIVEFAGAFLALMLVLRTNAGYDRWWEARRLWGGIVNQSRNLAIGAAAYGPDPAWRDRFVRWVAAFAHVCRRSLRGQHHLPEVERLLGAEVAERIAGAPHMPSWVSLELASLLREAHGRGALPDPVFLQLERQRALLVDHLGACERILNTRFPSVHRIALSQLTVLYVAAFPFAILSPKFWVVPAVTMAVAYPLFAIDQIARELGNPFSENNRSHLPLDEVTKGIEGTLLEMLGRAADQAPEAKIST
jgi:putative membrane protein